jgi:hypothetical protein
MSVTEGSLRHGVAGGLLTGARAKAWCLSIHAKALLSLSLGRVTQDTKGCCGVDGVAWVVHGGLYSAALT